MNIRLSVPSKTFLVGEYGVLRGGPAIVLNTEPRFELVACQSRDDIVKGIPKGAPADGWIRMRSPLFEGWQVEFIDPHNGRGGFGASGAQFVMAHAFSTFLQSSVSRAVEGYDLHALWHDYRVISGGQGSGADVLSQTVGGAAILNMATCEAHSSPWPFVDLGFAVVRTQMKITTHEHLKTLQLESLESLVVPTHSCIEMFRPGMSQKFVGKVTEFTKKLRELNLQSPATLALTEELEGKSWCQLAKGCGALGADTILVLMTSSDRLEALRGLDEMGLELIATDQLLSPGLEMKWSWNEG